MLSGLLPSIGLRFKRLHIYVHDIFKARHDDYSQLETNKDVSLQPCTAFLERIDNVRGGELQHRSQYRHLKSLVSRVWDGDDASGCKIFFEMYMSCTSNVPRQMRSRCTKIELIAGHCWLRDYVYKEKWLEGEREKTRRGGKSWKAARCPSTPCMLQTLSEGAYRNHTPWLRIPHQIQSVSFLSWHP